MTPPRFAHAFMISSVLSSYVEADVLRWDNGKVIPGTQGITPGPAVDLRNWNTDSHNLRYADLSAGLNLSAGDFTGSWLDYAHLQGANLTNALFRFATLSHADVSGAVVTGADLGSAIDFTAEQLYSTASYQAKNLQRVVLGYNDFTGWNFSGQDLSNAAFYGLDPSIADQRGSNLTSANLSGANLSDANFSYYVWDSGYYRGSDLTGSNPGLARTLGNLG